MNNHSSSNINDENRVSRIFSNRGLSSTGTGVLKSHSSTAGLFSARHTTHFAKQESKQQKPLFQSSLYGTRPLSSRAPLGTLSNNQLHSHQYSRQSTTTTTGHQAKPQRKPNTVTASIHLLPQNTDTSQSEEMNDLSVEPISPGLDRRDSQNPQFASDYIKDIYEHFRDTERLNMPDPNYMDRLAPSIDAKMRAILVDYVVSLHSRYRQRPETLYLAVNIMDRFLATENIAKGRLQTMAMASLLIASKYEEIMYIDPNRLVKNTKPITKEHVIQMESCILSALDFNITVATPFVFMSRFLKVAKANTNTYLLTHYIGDLSLVDIGSLKFQPSILGASAVYLARRMLNAEEAWNSNLEYYSKYNENDLMDCVAHLLRLVCRDVSSPQMRNVREKYKHETRRSIVMHVPYFLRKSGLLRTNPN